MMKHAVTKSRLKQLYNEKYKMAVDICDLSDTCIKPDTACLACVLKREESREEFNRITENKSKLVTIKEVQEAINILVILG
ncbi:MAG: hypothetical protein GY822_15995 [Deltaproteobacteria bacterium]|nr:hypothetical protein [Deltaproteobacteria bacterium]